MYTGNPEEPTTDHMLATSLMLMLKYGRMHKKSSPGYYVAIMVHA